ncbi:hypothetical protein QL285_003360 [Trifolium repens]|nr:hypothetical protein QL285_003360 [Trifolium repens]
MRNTTHSKKRDSLSTLRLGKTLASFKENEILSFQHPFSRGTEAAPRKLVTLMGCSLDKQFINTYSISTYCMMYNDDINEEMQDFEDEELDVDV